MKTNAELFELVIRMFRQCLCYSGEEREQYLNALFSLMIWSGTPEPEIENFEKMLRAITPDKLQFYQECKQLIISEL